MPIIAIISQPASNSLNAAYNPVILRVRADRTDGDPIPPVVYCDIYINSVYYKTLSKTIYDKLNLPFSSEFEFDVADALQERLRFQDPVNGATAIINASNVYASVQCKFRSSGYNTDGFLTPEGTAPIQGTGTTAPSSGTGTAGNTFIVINSSLQHEDNPDIASHLSFYKPSGTWASDAFPLTHRPAMHISVGQSDYYPIIYNNAKLLRCFTLHYKVKGASSYSTANICQPCLVEITGLVVSVDVDGNFVITWTNLNGTPYSVELQWSLNGVDWNSTSPIYNAGLTSAVVDDGLDVTLDYVWRAVPYCDTMTPGIGMLSYYFYSTNPGTNDIVVKNDCVGAFNVIRIFEDGVNLLPSIITPTHNLTIQADTSNPHKYGCRLFPNDESTQYEMNLVRAGVQIETFTFFGSLHANNTLQWHLQAGDILQIKES